MFSNIFNMYRLQKIELSVVQYRNAAQAKCLIECVNRQVYLDKLVEKQKAIFDESSGQILLFPITKKEIE